jgi:hypothetical protein
MSASLISGVVGKFLCRLANNKIAVFWVPTPCSLVGRYQRFGGICCHFSQRKNALKMEAAYFSETLVPTYQIARHHILQENIRI